MPYAVSMPAKVITFRSALKSSIGDFLADAKMTCAETEEGLISLVVALADYREEERPLFPRILICDDVATVLKNVQGTGQIEIGAGDRIPGTLQRALKKCAPLTSNGWAIWIERGLNTFTYGVFREPMPTALDIRATLHDTEDAPALRALLVAQHAAGTIELVSTGRPGIRIHLSGQRDEDVATEDSLSKVANSSAADIADEGDAKGSYINFFTTVLQDLLRRGHGTLIAVVPRDSDDWKSAASDAVVLREPIDLAGQLAVLLGSPTAVAYFELASSIEVISGMLNSDGITVFDSGGRVVGFNWFIRTETDSLAPSEKLGGARHRAYFALGALVSSGDVLCCYIRSSDGGDQAQERNSDG